MKTIAIAEQKWGAGKPASTINRGVGLNQLGERVTIFDYKPDGHGAEDYLVLCREIVGRGRQKMKKILLIIIYLSDLVNEVIRDLVKKYKVRAKKKQ